MGEGEELLPLTVVADELGLTYERVRQLAASGELAATRVLGRYWAVSRAELERLKAKPRPKPGPAPRKRPS